MTDWNPMDEVPSHMTPEQRREFWDLVRESNIERIFRPRDGWDELYPPLPGSLRERVLQFQDEIAAIADEVADELGVRAVRG